MPEPSASVPFDVAAITDAGGVRAEGVSAEGVSAVGGAIPDTLELTLRERFQLPQFRAMQREAVEAVLAGRDTFVVMPTGGGKSLCYQLPAVLLPGVTLVISPLIALMKDQVDRLQKLAIPAVALNSTLSFPQMRNVLRRVRSGLVKVVFVSPERLESSAFREELATLNISLLAIDEAHCISEWGHDFRTSYRRVPEAFSAFVDGKRPPILALTATATPEVRQDIKEQLALKEPVEIITGFERRNLSYGVLRQCDKEARVRDILQSVTAGSSIVYCSTRKSVEATTRMLRQFGFAADPYHAGLPLEIRRKTQDRFLAGRTTSIVATSAFGMGVDKPDVRVVIHYDLPASLEAYYQEAGRAGRDGVPAHAVLLFNNGDARVQEFLIRSSTPTEAEIRSVYVALHDIAGNTYGSIYPGILQTDSAQILQRIVKPEAPLERIIEVLEQAEYVRYYRNANVEQRSRVLFTTSRERVEETIFKSNSKHIKAALAAIVRRTGAEAFQKEVYLDHEDLLRTYQLTREDFLAAVRSLESLGILRFTLPTRGPAGVVTFSVGLLGERMPPQHLRLGAEAIQARLEASLRKLEQMVAYATEWSCRRNTILNYFGERPLGLYCGTCDVCVARSRPMTEPYAT